MIYIAIVLIHVLMLFSKFELIPIKFGFFMNFKVSLNMS